MLKITPIKQIKYAYCGPATAEIILAFWGIQENQQNLGKLCKTTFKKGTNRENLIKCLEGFGLQTKQGTCGNWSLLNALVNKEKVPVIVGWFYEDDGHYSIIFKLTKKDIWLTESCEGEILKMSWQKFDQLWFGFDDKFPKEKNIIPNWYLAVSQ